MDATSLSKGSLEEEKMKDSLVVVTLSKGLCKHTRLNTKRARMLSPTLQVKDYIEEVANIGKILANAIKEII